MADSFGLSANGFKGKGFKEIKGELESELLSHVDPTLRFSPDTIAGIITGIIANQASQVWESLNGLYHSLQPHSASGRALDALCSLTGTYRKREDFSRATALLTLDAKTKVTKESRLQTLGGHFFKVTNGVTNTSEVSAVIEADLIAEEAGEIIAHEDTEAKIMTPIAGWRKAKFKRTYEIGRLKESDDELRLRRFKELKATGSSTVDAICSRLGQIDHVEAVYIKEHPRSFEAIVKGGNDQDIAYVLWQSKPLGVETVGAIECTIIDSTSTPRKIHFNRPWEIQLSLHANLKVKCLLEENALNKLKTSLIDFGKKHFSLGSEVYASRFFPCFFTNPQVLDVMTLQLRDRSSGHVAPTEFKPEQIASLAFKDIHIEQVLETAQ